MAAKKRRSRTWMTIGAAVIVLAGMTYAFWPRPVMVDMGQVRHAPMIVTIDEEGRTRVRESYVVSTPIAGRLMRVQVEAGDSVEGGKTVVARMLPANPEALNIRSREQARADVRSAEASLRVARAQLNEAIAAHDLAESDLSRARTLRTGDAMTQAALDRAEQAARATRAAQDSAQAGISMRIAALDRANAQLISFNDPRHGDAAAGARDTTNVTAPVTGRILRVIQVSETTVPAGAPILEIGDISNDLEVVVELLSTDAVQVSVGDRVIVDDWGGEVPLDAVVERIDPWGFTKFSALGVEEQRVNAVVRFKDPTEKREKLGHGYRVEARIVVWEDENALTVPSSSLFRDAGRWALFAVKEGRAISTLVEVGRNNGVQAQVISGISAGAELILYPGAGIEDGTPVARRTIN